MSDKRTFDMEGQEGEDYGFTVFDSPPADEPSTENLFQRLRDVEALILPLLENLHRTADKANIHWPNRDKILKEKINALLKLTRDGVSELETKTKEI